MSNIRTTSNGQIVPRTQQQAAAIVPAAGSRDLATMLAKMTPELAKALPKHITADKMARVALTALRTSPDLAKTSPASFFGCLLQLAALGLEPNSLLGQAYLIPRNNSRTGEKDCTLIVGYRGLVNLLWNSGDVLDIQAEVVREGDHFVWEQGLSPKLEHQPTGDDDSQVTHAYAVVRFKNGGSMFRVLTRAQVEKRRSKGFRTGESSSPWVTNYEEMAKKSALRALLKIAPLSSDKIHTAAAIDERHEDGNAWAAGLDAEATKLVESLATPEQTDEPKSNPVATDHSDSVSELLGKNGGAQ